MFNRFLEKLKRKKKPETPVDEKSEDLTKVLTIPTEEIEIDNNTTASTELVQILDDNNTSWKTDFVEVVEEQFPPEWLLEKSDDPDIQAERDDIIERMNNKIEEWPIGVSLAKEYINKLPYWPSNIIAQYGFTSKTLVECINHIELNSSSSQRSASNRAHMFVRSKHHGEEERHYNKKFDGQFTTEVAKALIKKKEYRILFANLKYFCDLDVSIIHKLIDKFNKKDESLISECRRNDDVISLIYYNKDSFGKLDKKTLNYILDSEQPCYAIWMIEKFDFPWVDYKDIVRQVLKAKDSWGVRIRNFSAIIPIEDILSIYVETKQLKKLLNFSELCELGRLGITHQDIADLCIKNKEYKLLAENLSNLKWLDINIADALIKQWYAGEVKKNISSFDQ